MMVINVKEKGERSRFFLKENEIYSRIKIQCIDISII